MPKIYKKHSSMFKAKVALEDIKEQRPLGELSKEYSVASSQISTWKKTAEENLSSFFDTKHERFLLYKKSWHSSYLSI